MSALGIFQAFHTPYRPRSSGKVDPWAMKETGPTDERHNLKPGGRFDPHVYIYRCNQSAKGGGVPDEFKARDQVKAGFESLFGIVTINKNVCIYITTSRGS
ncbi:hypothetical protein GDO78_012866 [Eleutherodactylus coqui]|uniref:Uncharacterized protein n=1 Tax=Eleutherodactylus coqui TaxID=57060 RepID=A0A8J6F254_ELECQ|nr:hypothetical protein GDO78_012866 [Eleutherodactylus coqui]